MAAGISNFLANSWLDALGNNTSFAVTTVFIKLHVGDPGPSATANAAIETSRKEASFSAASTGTLTSDAAITYTNIAGSQDATFFSAFDNETAGNFLFSGTITANAYTAGDTFTISSGSLTVSLTVAS
jgi:hypothetical protein